MSSLDGLVGKRGVVQEARLLALGFGGEGIL